VPVLLHGFAGTARHWDRVAAALGPSPALALDLLDADPLTPDGVAALVSARAPERFTLVGYSMGGRLALHSALALGTRVERLVLVSASAGIDDLAARERRRAADEQLAGEIELRGIDWFVERWRGVPLFAGDADWVHEDVAVDERRSTPASLAASLRAFGPGSMTPMWDRLGELTRPVAILAGERDEAYVTAGRRLAGALPDATLTIVPGAGHRLALEAPDAVAAAIAS
jgi:2-succinyl-6-hydroxy-2,4-cyclohexadiene-1-carboxylate synthase